MIPTQAKAPSLPATAPPKVAIPSLPTPAQAKSTPAPSKTKVKVNLNEVTRKKATAATAPAFSAAATSPSAASTEEVTAQLAGALTSAGAANATKSGRSGSPTGQDNAFSHYYDLIKNQMFEAWIAPADLANQGLVTLIMITVAADGTITKIELARTSGNDRHDHSALEAVRRVGKLRRPPPDGMPENVSINFKVER
jgi:TolA protein